VLEGGEKKKEQVTYLYRGGGLEKRTGKGTGGMDLRKIGNRANQLLKGGEKTERPLNQGKKSVSATVRGGKREPKRVNTCLRLRKRRRKYV